MPFARNVDFGGRSSTRDLDLPGVVVCRSQRNPGLDGQGRVVAELEVVGLPLSRGEEVRGLCGGRKKDSSAMASLTNTEVQRLYRKMAFANKHPVRSTG